MSEERTAEIRMAELTFKMPPVEHGQVIAWYPSGTASTKPQVGYVDAVGVRSISVLTARAGVKETVRHIADPKLKRNPDQRESGAWDYTAAEKRLCAVIAEMNDRLTVLESGGAKEDEQQPEQEHETDNCEFPPDLEKASKKTEYSALLEQASSLGIEIVGKRGRPSAQWLRQQIALRTRDDDIPSARRIATETD